MHLQTSHRDTMYGAANEELAGSWLVRDEEKRKWLSRELSNAIYQEWHEHAGAEVAGSKARERLVKAVRERVNQRNHDCASSYGGGYGFVIWPILLAAVLSWLITRLLDRLFPLAPATEGTPCGNCNCFNGVTRMGFIDTGAGWLGFGWLELKRIVRAVPISVTTAVVAWLTEISTNAGAGGSAIAGVLATLALIFLKNLLQDNTGKTN